MTSQNSIERPFPEFGEFSEEKGMAADCKKFSVELSEYFDGELDEAASLKLENHLKSCPTCPLELEKLKKLHNALNDMAAPTPGRRSILADLQAKLQEEGLGSPDKSPLAN